MKYRVQWTYKSSLGGPWGAGDVVELGERQAEAINLDSPGVLQPVLELRVEQGKQDRMERGKSVRRQQRRGV